MATIYGGSGDPRRSLELLWRTGAASTRGPKPGLDVDRVVAQAIELADAEGIPALSMRRLAEAFGVGTMTLYTYVPAKAELYDLMVDTVLGEVVGPFDGEGGWRGGLERIARANWAMYHRHPWMLEVAVTRPVLGPNVSLKYEHELRVLDGVGLSDLEMDAALTLVVGHVEGAARRALEARQVEQRTGLTDAEWWAAHAPILEKVMDDRDFPIASRVGSAAGEAHQGAYGPEHAFEFGLARILDGIEALISSRA